MYICWFNSLILSIPQQHFSHPHIINTLILYFYSLYFILWRFGQLSKISCEYIMKFLLFSRGWRISWSCYTCIFWFDTSIKHLFSYFLGNLFFFLWEMCFFLFPVIGWWILCMIKRIISWHHHVQWISFIINLLLSFFNATCICSQ